MLTRSEYGGLWPQSASLQGDTDKILFIYVGLPTELANFRRQASEAVVARHSRQVSEQELRAHAPWLWS